jgi:hypothetical protein
MMGYNYSSKEYDNLGLWMDIVNFTKPDTKTPARVLGDTYFHVQWGMSNGYSNVFYLDIINPFFSAAIMGTLYKEPKRIQFAEDEPELVWCENKRLSVSYPYYIKDDRCDFSVNPLKSTWDEVDSAIMALRLLAS